MPCPSLFPRQDHAKSMRMLPLDGSLAKHSPARMSNIAANDHQSTSWLAAVLTGCCFAPRVTALQMSVSSIPPAGRQPNSPSLQPSLKPDGSPPDTLGLPPHITVSQADSLPPASHTTKESPHLQSNPAKHAVADAIAVSSQPLVTAVAQLRADQSGSPVTATPDARLDLHSKPTVPHVLALEANKTHTSSPSALQIPLPAAPPLEMPITITSSSTSRPHRSVETIHHRAPQQRPSPPLTMQRRVTEPSASLHPPLPQPFSIPQPQPSAPTLTTANLESIHILEAEWNTRRSNSKRNQLVQSWLHAAAEESAKPSAPRSVFSPPGLDLLDLSGSEDGEVPRSVHGQHRSSDAGERGTFPRRVASKDKGGVRKQANHQHSADGGSSDQRDPQQRQRSRRHPSSVQIHGSNHTTLTPTFDSVTITPVSSVVGTLPPASSVQATDLHNNPYPALVTTRGGKDAATRQAQTTAVSAGQGEQLGANAPALQHTQGSHRWQPTPPIAETPCRASLDTGGVAARAHRPVSRTLTSPTPFAQTRAAAKAAVTHGVHPHGPPPTSAHHVAHGPRVTLAPRGMVSVSSEVTNGSLVIEHVPVIPARALAADAQNPALAERFRCVDVF